MTAAPIALVDMDNTLCDYSSALNRDMALLRAPQEETTLSSYAKSVAPHLKAREELIRRQPGWWLGLEPLKAGFQILRELQRLKFDIHILTKGPWRSSNAWTEKVEWCRKHVPGIPLTITQEKSLVYGRILVDDWLPYAEPWLQVRPRGLVVMPAQPWNAGVKDKRILRFSGAKDLPALRDALRKQFGRK